MPRTMPGVTHLGPWLCLGILLLLSSLPVRAATQGGEALYIHKWMPLPSPLLDNSVTVDTRFQITSDVESDDYRLILAGLSNSLAGPPELALVYEHVLGGGFWPKARLLLAAPVTSIPSALLAQTRNANQPFADHIVFLPLAELDQPLETSHSYKASLAVRPEPKEVSIVLQDSTSNQELCAGYLTMASLPTAAYAVARSMLAPGSENTETTPVFLEVEDLVAQDAYTRFGPPFVLSGLRWQLVEGAGAAAKALFTKRVSGTVNLSARVEWPASALDGMVELRDSSGSEETTIARTAWQPTPVDLPLGNLSPGAHHLTLWYVSKGDAYQLGSEELQVLAGIQRIDLSIQLPDATNPLWVQPLHSQLSITTSQAIDNVDVEVIGEIASAGGDGAQQMLIDTIRIEHLPKGVSQYSLILEPPSIQKATYVMVTPRVFGVQFTPAKRLRTAGAWKMDELELRLANAAILATQTIVGNSPEPLQVIVSNTGSARIERAIASVWLAADSARRGVQAEQTQYSTTTHVTLAPGETTVLSVPVPGSTAKGWFTLQLGSEETNITPVTLGPFYLGIPDTSPKDITLQAGVMNINGSAVLLRGVGFYDYNQRTANEWQRDLRLYAAWGMNLVEVFARPGSAATFRSFLDTAKRAGLYVAVEIDNSICDLPAKQRANELLPYLAHWDHPSLVAWVLRDDSFYDPHYPGLVAVRSLIRQYDTRTPITTTLLDARVADRLTAQQWANWASVLDFPIPYEYPVLRDGRVFNPLYRTTGGLDTVQTLAERTRTYWRDPELYMWQWVQSHSQRVTIEELGFGAYESYTATPDQLRLLTYLTITAGVKGLLYYRDRFFTDEDYGVGRRNELAMTWNMLGRVEDILAGGDRFVVQKPLGGRSGDGVEVTGFRKGAEQLLLVVQHRFADVRFVGSGRIEPFTVSVPALSAGSQVFLLTPIGVTPVSSVNRDGVLTFQTPTLDLTGAFLITDDLARANAIDAALKERLTVTAHSALLLLADTIAKIATVTAHLPALPNSEAVLAEVEGIYRQAIDEYDAGAWEKAFLKASGAGEQLRLLAKAQLDAAEQADFPVADRKYLASYFSLPKLYGYKASYEIEVATRLARLTAPLGGVGASTR